MHLEADYDSGLQCVRVLHPPGVTDSRKSWRSLAEMADTRMGMSIREKAMFLFCNRSRNCIKILVWDNGYWVMMKRIPKGTFA